MSAFTPRARIEHRAGYTVRVRGAAPAAPIVGSPFAGGVAPAIAFPVSDREACETLAGPFRDWRRRTGASARFRAGRPERHPQVATYEPPESLKRDAARMARQQGGR